MRTLEPPVAWPTTVPAQSIEAAAFSSVSTAGPPRASFALESHGILVTVLRVVAFLLVRHLRYIGPILGSSGLCHPTALDPSARNLPEHILLHGRVGSKEVGLGEYPVLKTCRQGAEHARNSQIRIKSERGHQLVLSNLSLIFPKRLRDICPRADSSGLSDRSAHVQFSVADLAPRFVLQIPPRSRSSQDFLADRRHRVQHVADNGGSGSFDLHGHDVP